MIKGGKGKDHVADTIGRNHISCGKGIDRVWTNDQSVVSPNCESVTRRRGPPLPVAQAK